MASIQLHRPELESIDVKPTYNAIRMKVQGIHLDLFFEDVASMRAFIDKASDALYKIEAKAIMDGIEAEIPTVRLEGVQPS